MKRLEKAVSLIGFSLNDTIAFFIAAVKRIAEEILVSKLTDVSYDPKVCRDLTLRISDAVKSQVKLLGFDRYKIVCVTHIGPKMGKRFGSEACVAGTRKPITLQNVALQTARCLPSL